MEELRETVSEQQVHMESVQASLRQLERKEKSTVTTFNEEQVFTPYTNSLCELCRRTCHEACGPLCDALGCCINLRTGECSCCRHHAKYHARRNYKLVTEERTHKLITAYEESQLSKLRSEEYKMKCELQSLHMEHIYTCHQIQTEQVALYETLEELHRLCPQYDYVLQLRSAIEMLKEDRLAPPQFPEENLTERNTKIDQVCTKFQSLLTEFEKATNTH
ncbi:hypothetical protein Pelo_18233 [Pelomyxa schiedti]|nr:hypothetical protein Pelo_18233 [Pelomyxa schiedti]